MGQRSHRDRAAAGCACLRLLLQNVRARIGSCSRDAAVSSTSSHHRQRVPALKAALKARRSLRVDMILSRVARRALSSVPRNISVSLYGGRLPLNAVGSVALVRDRVVVTPYDANTSRDIRASLAEALPENRRVYYDSKSGQVVVAPADSPRRAKQAREPRNPRPVELDEDLAELAVDVELSTSSPTRRSKTRRPRTKVSKRSRRGDELDYRYERRASGGNKTRRQLDRELARRYEYVDSVIVDEIDEEAL